VGPKTFLKNFFARRRSKMPLSSCGWLGRRMHDPDLWHFGRRSVAGGVGLGLFLAFVPVPIQMLLAVPCAIVMRVNLPVTFAAIWVTNPITFAPMFIFAYKVGTIITGHHNAGGLPFVPTFDGVAAMFHEIWYPLIVGCFVCGLSAGAVGSLMVRWIWRFYLVRLRRHRLREGRARKKMKAA